MASSDVLRWWVLLWLAAVPCFAVAQTVETDGTAADIQDTLAAAGLTVYRDFIKHSEKGGYELIVKENDVFRGKNPVEILERLPYLRKDAGSLVMDGRAGIKVFIDGREVRLSGALLMGYLRTIPSSSIRSIEVSPTPPSSCDAAGNDIRLSSFLSLGLDVKEAVPGLYDYRRSGNSFCTDVGLTYTHEKSGLQLNVEVTDIFKSSSPAYEYCSSGVRQRYDNYYDSRALEVSLLWEFGNRFNEIRHKSSSNAEERSRL